LWAQAAGLSVLRRTAPCIAPWAAAHMRQPLSVPACCQEARSFPHLSSFLLQFADAAGRGVELSPPPFRQADMPNLRIKVTSDIMAGKVA
jgi:hypothetical protein